MANDNEMTVCPLPPAERLREPATVMDPDIRTSMFVGQATPSLAVHHAEIATIRLSPAVPEPFAIQFETARNLYLYAWHVYRFYMVAVVQALTTLELGLKTRLPARLPEPYQRKWQKRAMLAGMLGYAIDQGIVRNEGFRRWHDAAERTARQRRSFEAVRTMIAQQLEVMEFDDAAPVEITPEDQRWDLVAGLRESLPQHRNELAHGSTMLTRQVRGTIEIVGESSISSTLRLHDPVMPEALPPAPNADWLLTRFDVQKQLLDSVVNHWLTTESDGKTTGRPTTS